MNIYIYIYIYIYGWGGELGLRAGNASVDSLVPEFSTVTNFPGFSFY
jgi:hypothetical protein